MEQTPTERTVIEVLYPTHRGRIGLRGEPPLSLRHSLKPARIDGNRHIFEVDLEPGALLQFRIIRNERSWSGERYHSAFSGERVVLEPTFSRHTGRLEPKVRLDARPYLDRDLWIEVFLPPTYDEHETKRYPVLYAQDGQALYSTSTDLFDGHSWLVDSTLDNLYSLGAMREIIVVALHTAEDRLNLLSPTVDPEYGGGAGPKYRDFIIEAVKPYVDRSYRTLAGRADTALMGSSMGGLFSFFAAWTRSDVFGRAACLSSSFWWENRTLIREVQKGVCPYPRPWLYLDSGAAISPYQRDGNLLDGCHNTLAMSKALIDHCYVAGADMHALAFPGMKHNNASWAARLSVPLQLLFPVRGVG